MTNSVEAQNLHQSRHLLIVSNRLPVTVTLKNGEFKFKQSVGGLVSGLSVYFDSLNGISEFYAQSIWVGWPGIGIENSESQQTLTSLLLSKSNAFPVYVNEETMDKFYHDFSNKLIWPLFNYFPTYAIYDEEFWDY